MASNDPELTPTETETHYPLLFTFHHRVAGHGYLAGITTDGRALVREEGDGDWWIDGVWPAHICDGGGSFDEAVAAFKRRLELVYIDFAHEAKDVAAFRALVEQQCAHEDVEVQQAWEAARLATRAGEAGLGHLGRIAEPREPSVNVDELELKPSANKVDGDPKLAA